MVLSEHQILAWLGQFLWPFLRITGLFLTDPLYGSVFIPAPVKAASAATLAAALALWLPELPPFPGDAAAAILQGILQISFGALLGMTMQVAVYSIACVGEIAGLSMGLSFAELQFKEATTATPVIYDIMFWIGIMAYITIGGPVWLFGALAHSFQSGVSLGDLSHWNDLTQLGGNIMRSAIWLAMPVLAVTLSINITVGLTSVFAPQLNILTIGFPLLILAGLWMLIGSVPYMNQDIHAIFLAAMHSATRMLAHG
jgi:flagellar biosynthetic protein FliR